MPTDYFDLEKKRSDLLENTLNTSSYTLRVFLFYKYFSDILSLGDRKTEEAFLEEFVDEFLSALTKFDIWGIEPLFIEKLLSHLNELKNREMASAKTAVLNNIIGRIAEQYRRLDSILKGRITDQNYEPKAYFPLIDRGNIEGLCGIIESVIVRINKASAKNNFIIIPSDKNIDTRIIEQCENSWQTALKILIRYVKRPFRYHEVIISFEKKEGYYEGISLGTALTLSFLKELMEFYNPVYLLGIEPGSAFTGGVSAEGKTLATGSEIIKQKTAAVFYSAIKTFVIPKAEENDAVKELNELKNKYPQRELKLVPAEDITDILNRRDLVEIKKRNAALRIGRFVKKNLVLVSINLFLIAVILFFLIKDIDTNPYTFTADGRKIYVKNSSGKVLWEKNVGIADRLKNIPGYLKKMVRIIDINEDGKNEVIIAGEDNEGSILRCYSTDSKILWNYSFQDKVYSERESLNTEYNLVMLDTLSFYGNKSLFLIANNQSSFSSAIIRIDLKTGNRLSGTFWSSGHGVCAIIKDIDNDKKWEIMGLGYDNGYEDVVFFVYDPDTLIKVRPTTREYLIRNYAVAEMKYYMRFSKTDYDIYYKFRTPTLGSAILTDDSRFRKYKFGVDNPLNPESNEIGYEIGYDFNNVIVVIDSRFRIQRDTLVAHGILKPPYTDTEAYKNIIKNNILYWKDGIWVKREEPE